MVPSAASAANDASIVSGSKLGTLAMASTSPVRGSIATPAPRAYWESASYNSCWTAGSIVVTTVAPTIALAGLRPPSNCAICAIGSFETGRAESSLSKAASRPEVP